MGCEYIVVISFKAPHGLSDIGTFQLGEDVDFAFDTFNNFKGDADVSGNPIILTELIKREGNLLPIPLKSISCTLEQCADNCKVLVRDLFKRELLKNK